MTSKPVPPRKEGQGAEAKVYVQQDLASRTAMKLRELDDWDNPETLDQAKSILNAAFKEAHCDFTLHGVHWWDLGGNARILADGDISIPYPSLPTIGTVITWNGQTYYVASLRDPGTEAPSV